MSSPNHFYSPCHACADCFLGTCVSIQGGRERVTRTSSANLSLSSIADEEGAAGGTEVS